MKKLFILVIVILGMVGLLWATGFPIKHFWRGTTLTANEVKKIWGHVPFDEVRFKAGDTATRASMAYSLMKEKKSVFIGKPVSEVRTILGPYSGYYFSDIYPAYFIQEGKNHNEDTWQIVFLIDRNRKIADIIVHKNCCDK